MLVPESIYESIKHLKPRSEEEIRTRLKNLSPKEKLITGAEEGLLWLVKDALDAGADVHAIDDCALRCASENGHAEIVKVLLQIGADVHAIDDCALRYASYKGHTEVVKVLLDAGANVHAEDDRALRWASLNGHTEVGKLLKQYINKNKKDMKKKKLVRESIIEQATEPATKPVTKPVPTKEPGITPGTRPIPQRPNPFRKDRPSVQPRPKATADEVAKRLVGLSKKDKQLRNLLKKKYPEKNK